MLFCTSSVISFSLVGLAFPWNNEVSFLFVIFKLEIVVAYSSNIKNTAS